jgi:hypothetical protein
VAHPMIANHLPAARQEIHAKTQAEIDAEAADVWGARALAAYELWRATQNLEWYSACVEWRHEALEHAAGGPPGTLERIVAELEALARGT